MQSQNERISISLDQENNPKKDEAQSDDEIFPHQGSPRNQIFQIDSQDLSQKVQSNYVKEYLNFFELSSDYKLQLPQITEDISRILVQNGIRFAREYFHSKPKIKFRKTSPSYSLIELQILLGNFTVLLKILNLQQELPQNSNFEQQGGGDAKGSFGEVHFLDWDELINSKDFITIEQLRGPQVPFQHESYAKQKNQFATKIFYFPDKNSLLQFEAVEFKYEKIFEFILQYAICKITSCFRVGLSVSHPFGFDFVCYRNCIQFFMQRGQPISNYLEEDIELVIKELKRKLLLLHSLHIVHRDIKFDNLLYSPTFNTIVFIDFGLSEMVKQCVGQKTKSTYKGSYFFLSQQVKKLMFQEQDFYVDLYWNDAVGLIKTKNMLKKIIQSSFDIKYSESYKIKIDVAEQQLKAKRMINMKNYLKIKLFETISVKNVELSKKVIENVEKLQKISLISEFIFFLKGLESCPRYDQFSLYLLQQFFKCEAYIAQIQQKNQDKYYCLDKSTFLKRYENSSKNIQTHIQVFNEDWKKPLDMLCKQYLLTSKKQIQFSIYTFCCSVMFQNINNAGYIFKKLLKTFTGKIIDYFKKSFEAKSKKFVFRSTKQSDSECDTCQNELTNKSYQDSQKYIIVQDYLIELNKPSAVLMTKFIEEAIFQFFKIAFNEQSHSFSIQFLDSYLEKFYVIKKQIDETYLVSKDKISKIIIIIFKIYIKESAYNESIRFLHQKIKLYCSRQVYMRQLLEIINTHLIQLSFDKFEAMMNEVQSLFRELKLKFQFTEPNYRLQKEKFSQKKLYSLSQNERQQRYAQESLQFQITLTKIKFQIFHNITQKNAYEMKRRLQNDLKDELESLRFKIPNSLFNRKHLDLLNLYIVCNAFMGKQLQNLDLIGQYYDLANSLTFQRDVFQGLNTTHTYISSRGNFVADEKIKSYKKRIMIDSSALYIEFEDAEFLERFNFNSFMVDILNNSSNDREKTTEKLQNSLGNVDQYKRWQGQLEDQFLMRKNSVYSNYLSFAFNYKLKEIYNSIKEKVILNFKAIANIDQSDTYQTIRLKFKSLQNTIVGFIDLRSQEESQSIYELYELFVDLVEQNFEFENDYPEMYFVSKAYLLERLNFNSGELLQRQQLQYMKLSLYYPAHLNYLSFKQCAMFIQNKMSWDSSISKNMRDIVYHVLNAILIEQITDHVTKFQVFTLKVLRFLFYDDKILQAIHLLALICKYFYKTKSVKSYMYYRIVKKLANRKFLKINQTTLQKVNHIIPQMIWKSDFSIMYEIAELSIFWGYLMFTNQDSIEEKLLKKLPLLFNLTSIESREQIQTFYFQMGAIFFKRIGKKSHFKNFLKQDLRYNPQINKDLYLKSFLTFTELTYLLQYTKSTDINFRLSNKLIGLHRKLILQKLARRKQKNK